MPVGLLEPREVWPGPRCMPVEELKTVLAVVRVPVWNHVWEGERLGPAAELVLCSLLLFNFLREKQRQTKVGLSQPAPLGPRGSYDPPGRC